VHGGKHGVDVVRAEGRHHVLGDDPSRGGGVDREASGEALQATSTISSLVLSLGVENSSTSRLARSMTGISFPR
jgi:hypothetical protein